MAVTYEQVRDWVLALPGGREVMVESWGHPTLRVGDKMFAGGAPDSPTMSVKASKEDQAELVASDPQTYAVAASTTAPSTSPVMPPKRRTACRSTNSATSSAASTAAGPCHGRPGTAQ